MLLDTRLVLWDPLRTAIKYPALYGSHDVLVWTMWGHFMVFVIGLIRNNKRNQLCHFKFEPSPYRIYTKFEKKDRYFLSDLEPYGPLQSASKVFVFVFPFLFLIREAAKALKALTAIQASRNTGRSPSPPSPLGIRKTRSAATTSSSISSPLLKKMATAHPPDNKLVKTL